MPDMSTVVEPTDGLSCAGVLSALDRLKESVQALDDTAQTTLAMADGLQAECNRLAGGRQVNAGCNPEPNALGSGVITRSAAFEAALNAVSDFAASSSPSDDRDTQYAMSVAWVVEEVLVVAMTAGQTATAEDGNAHSCAERCTGSVSVNREKAISLAGQLIAAIATNDMKVRAVAVGRA